MKDRKFWRVTGNYLMVLMAGCAISLSSGKVLSSFAGPISNSTFLAANESTTKVAVAPISADSFVADAIVKTGPAVVRIDTEKVVTRSLNPMLEDPFFQDFFGRQVPTNPQREKVVGQGSGFIVSKDGIILTNAHVVDDAQKVTVTLKDGRTFQGTVKGTDDVTDLAVVQIDPQGDDLPIAPLGNSDDVKVGDWAIAVGNPVGLNNTVTLGIISTLSRSSAQVGIPDKRIDFLQTDAAINPGNSGGPLLNARGEVIGINTAIRADAMGIGFAIPINIAKELQGTLASGQEVAHPYIGVQMITLTPELAQQSNSDPNSPILLPEVQGVLVVQVLPNTPAQQAGIRLGDVITKVNNKPVTDGSQLQSLVEATGINKPLTLSIIRGERTLDITVTTAQLANQS
jgi:S1-C subfamily serine protease